MYSKLFAILILLTLPNELYASCPKPDKLLGIVVGNEDKGHKQVSIDGYLWKIFYVESNARGRGWGVMGDHTIMSEQERLGNAPEINNPIRSIETVEGHQNVVVCTYKVFSPALWAPDPNVKGAIWVFKLALYG